MTLEIIKTEQDLEQSLGGLAPFVHFRFSDSEKLNAIVNPIAVPQDDYYHKLEMARELAKHDRHFSAEVIYAAMCGDAAIDRFFIQNIRERVGNDVRQSVDEIMP